MNDNKIIILLGSSCSGKDTIAKLLQEEGYNFVVSTTTRPIRIGESEREPYIFTNNDYFEFLIKSNLLIEYREYKTQNGDIWYYGVEEKEIDKNKNYIAVLDPVGLDGFNQFFKEGVVSFYLCAGKGVRKQRCIDRGDYNEQEWEHRLISDNNMFTDDYIDNNVDYRISAERTPTEALEQILSKLKNKE